ncbi:LacI family DNA-binding transcriptional regulator [Psychromonas ossibalaenae]|uniref:LacI family DNA-binding transcriptional regulator n=1 Tax=Psychromonas ossibalaenae TaxID=444922 RepID=UPI0003A9A0A6|nr:LacI family DNA-binding transcriptional regulator [Psychromonas ossibalaenae]
MYTIVDVAKYCGVSTATVSMALNNKGRLSPATRAKVLEAVDKLGYVYNQTAANLRNNESNQVGLLLNDITNPFYSELTLSLNQEMELHNKMLFLANSEDSPERQRRIIESFISHKVGGMVICPALGLDLDFLVTLKRRQIPVVLAVRNLEIADYDFVGTDNFQGARLITQHLINLGHRKIAFLGGMQGSKTRANRLAGYISVLLENDINLETKYSFTCESNRKASEIMMNGILDHYPEITAVICYQDIVAFGAMRALHTRNINIGKEIALTGFDDIPEAADTHPELTTISVSAKEIGRKAGEVLLKRIHGNTENPQHIIIPPTLIIRHSCGS